MALSEIALQVDFRPRGAPFTGRRLWRRKRTRWVTTAELKGLSPYPFAPLFARCEQSIVMPLP